MKSSSINPPFVAWSQLASRAGSQERPQPAIPRRSVRRKKDSRAASDALLPTLLNCEEIYGLSGLGEPNVDTTTYVLKSGYLPSCSTPLFMLARSPASKGCTHARTATTRLYDTRGPSSGDILDGIGPTGRPAKLFLSPQKIASGPPSIRAARLAKTVRTVTDVAYKEGRAAEKKRVSMKEKRERAREDT